MSALEQRRLPRYVPKVLAFASLSPYCGRVGQIKDISKGGLAFEFLQIDDVLEPIATETTSRLSSDILLLGNEVYLPQVPCTVVYEIPLPTGSFLAPQRVQSWRCGLEFGSLGKTQARALSRFIDEFVLTAR